MDQWRHIMTIDLENRLHQFNQRNIYLLILSMIIFSLFFSHHAHAGLCAMGTVKEVGTWINPDNDTGGATKAVFTEECRDASEQTCNENSCTGVAAVKVVYTAEVWGKCHPTDCYWGKVDGVYTSGNWLHFQYDHGFAQRMVWGQVWSGNNDWLRLIIDTDFVSPSVSDYRFDEWMYRQ